jgi:outer membrane protein assembly factor BamB
MKPHAYISAFGAVLGLMVFSTPASADWPNFRGPKHDGISADSGFRTQWSEPIPVVWQRDVGSAYSSFAVVGNRVYTCGTADKKQVLYCLEADTGNVIWENAFEPAYRDNFGDGTRATPTVHDGRVYILGGHGRLLCVDAETGKEHWSKQFKHVPQWGYAGSVLVDGDLAIATAGKDQGTLVAFDRKTGEQRWQCGDDQVGYSTPYPFTFDGKRYIVGFSGKSAIITDAETGKPVWRTDWATDWDVNAAAPIYHDGHLFLTSGYQTGCALYKLQPDGDKLKAEQIWKSKVLMNKFQSCILHEGNLYSSDQNAIVCADFLTGEERWRVRRLDKGSAKHGTLVLADDHLLMLTEDGRLHIAPASTEGFEPVTTADILSGKCWTVSVLDDGRLFARNMDRVTCFRLKS